MAARHFFAFLLIPGVPAYSAPALGVAVSSGEFRLNGSMVRGNATLVEGAVVESLGAPSALRLRDGAVLQLDAGSRARVHAGHVTVESGGGEWKAAGTAPPALEALTLKLAAAETGSTARFRLADAGSTLQVHASRGGFQVLNAQGTLISRLTPGVALAFAPPAAASAAQSAPSSFIGCIVRKDGKFMLFEPSLNLLVELRGQANAVAREWGNRVQANGTSPAGAGQQPQGQQLMQVTNITRIEVGGCGELAKFANAEVPGGPPAGTTAPPSTQPAPPATSQPPSVPRPSGPAPTAREGMSAGTKYAIIAGVAGGGAAAALAAAGGSRSR